MKKSFLGLFFITLLVTTSVFANDDIVNMEALRNTQNLLKDSTQRNAAINESSAAQKADETVGVVSMGDSGTKESIYGIAAEVMPWLISQTNGDPIKMMEILEKAKKDPKAFLNSLPADQKGKIRNLGLFLDSKRSPSSSGPRP